MERVIEFLEKVINYAAQLGIGFCEMAGIIVLLLTAVLAFVNYFRRDEHIRLELAQGISLALEFKLGGEVLRTVIVREFSELAVLGAIILLRSVLTLLLHWEIHVEEEKEKLRLPKPTGEVKHGGAE